MKFRISEQREALIEKVEAEEAKLAAHEAAGTLPENIREEEREAYLNAFHKAARMLKGNPFPCNDTTVACMNTMPEPCGWMAEKLIHEPNMVRSFNNILDDNYKQARKYNEPVYDEFGLPYVYLKRPLEENEIELHDGMVDGTHPNGSRCIHWYVPTWFDCEEVFKDIYIEDNTDEMLNLYCLWAPGTEHADLIACFYTNDPEWLGAAEPGSCVELRVALDWRTQERLDKATQKAYERFREEDVA